MFQKIKNTIAPLPEEDLLGGVNLLNLLNDESIEPNSPSIDDMEKKIDAAVEEEKKTDTPKAEDKEIPKPEDKKVESKVEDKTKEVKTEEKTTETTDDTNNENGSEEPASNFALDLANEVAINLGVELVDDNGNPVEVPNDRVGLVKAVETLAENKANSLINDFISKHQIVIDFFEHIEAGKDPLQFLQKDTTVYANLDYTQEETAVNALTKFYTQKGIEPDVISAIIDKAKADGKLEASGKAAGLKLDEAVQKEKAETERILNEKREAAQKEEQARLNEIEKIISTGKLLGHQLPNTEVKGFKEFLTSKDKSGKPVLQEAWSKLNNEQRLLLNYLIYTDFKLLKGATSKVDAFAEAAKLAKDRQDRTKTESGTSTPKTTKAEKIDIGFDELEKLLK